MDVERRRVQEALAEKYDLLFDKYSIDKRYESKWKELAQHLARESYAGFTFAKSPQSGGRPTAWSAYVLALLWFDVQALKKSKKVRDAEAFRELCSIQPWRQLLYFRSEKVRDSKTKTLKNRYNDAEKSETVTNLIQKGVKKDADLFQEAYEDFSTIVQGLKLEHKCIR